MEVESSVLARRRSRNCWAEVAIVGTLLEHVVDDDQQRMCHSDQPSFTAATVHEVACMRLEVACPFCGWLPRPLAPELVATSELPLVVFPLRFLPALSLLPGDMPAQEARCASLGNGVMSGPISAIKTSATRRSTPGIASSFSRTGFMRARQFCDSFI